MASFAEEKDNSKKVDVDTIAQDLLSKDLRTVDPFAKILNMEVLWAGPEEAEGIMYVSPQVLNPYGTVHGGCLVALADSVAGHNMAAAGKLCVTQGSTVNFLNPANCKEVRCRSRIQKLGRRNSVVAVEAWDEQGTLLITALFTFSTMKEIPPHIIAPDETFSRLSFMEE